MPLVAALVVEYRPQPIWDDLDMAKEIKDELRKFSEVFQSSGIEDKDFYSTLEVLYEWMCEL